MNLVALQYQFDILLKSVNFITFTVAKMIIFTIFCAI